MLRRVLVASVVTFLCAAAASAQIKVMMAGQCAKPDSENTLAVADHPNHAFTISQAKCTYTKPTEIEGRKATGGTAWQSGEVNGETINYHGYYEETWPDGDQILYRYQGKGTVKDGAFQAADETWSVLRATGAHKAVKGKGTCKAKGNADGSSTFECEGDLQPPPAKNDKQK